MPDFTAGYAAALRAYLDKPTEVGLAAAHDLGREALIAQISVLDIVENHFRLVADVIRPSGDDGTAALQFLLHALATPDIAVQGFVDGARRAEEERARAEEFADREAFRTALVNAMQEGFFVVNRAGHIVEVNEAFAEITGYGREGLPYRWPYPWLPAGEERNPDRIDEMLQSSHLQVERSFCHRNGHLGWALVSMNAVNSAREAYVGTMRDITAQRKAAARDSALMRLATAAGVAKSVTEVLGIMLEECRPAIDSRRVVAVMWPPGGGDPTIQVVGEPADRRWLELDDSLRGILREAKNWPPLTVEPVASETSLDTSQGIVAVLSGEPTTVLWLQHRAPRPVGIDGRRLITALVGHLSLAVQHVRHYEAARETSLTLQRALLPSARPPAGFAVRYEPAVLPLEIGGDWYDVLPLDDHRIGIVVGDCVGRGLSAAAVMGQLRSSARALLLTGAEPARLLETLDSVAALIPGAYCATVFLGVLDTEAGTLRYSNAGHVPAIMASPGAGPTALTAGGSVPLAVQRVRPRPQLSVPLPLGATLMLYTDGLVERRNTSIDRGIGRVCELVADMLGAPAEAVADAALQQFTPPGGYDDDVAIVVYRHEFAPLRIDVPAYPERLGEIRDRLAGWLITAGADELLSSDIVLAVNEACTNSIEHAYRDMDPAQVRVEADVRDGQIELRVVDFGHWRTPDAHPRVRGRGLPMMRAVSSDVQVEPASDGTTVEMAFALPEPARS